MRSHDVHHLSSIELAAIVGAHHYVSISRQDGIQTGRVSYSIKPLTPGRALLDVYVVGTRLHNGENAIGCVNFDSLARRKLIDGEPQRPLLKAELQDLIIQIGDGQVWPLGKPNCVTKKSFRSQPHGFTLISEWMNDKASRS